MCVCVCMCVCVWHCVCFRLLREKKRWVLSFNLSVTWRKNIAVKALINKTQPNMVID